VTAVPRAVLAGDIDRAGRFLPYVIAALALAAATAAALFAKLLFARPLQRLSAGLGKIGQFRLDDVHYEPTFLAELDDFSRGLRRMAVGLTAFGRYIPVEVVRPLIASGAVPVPGGEIRLVTVMFADLPGFTAMSEKLGPDVEPYLTKFLTLAVDIIAREGGTVDKFIGDEVMAFWNAPNEVPDHAERACRAAMAIRAALHEIPLPLPEAGRDAGVPLPRVRIGINSGSAIIGNVGSAIRLSYTAIGDTVNLASRLIGIAKEQNVEIVVSDSTYSMTNRKICGRPLGVATVRGRSAPVRILTLDDGSGPLPSTLLLPKAAS